jgi:hypothetical protein
LSVLKFGDRLTDLGWVIANWGVRLWRVFRPEVSAVKLDESTLEADQLFLEWLRDAAPEVREQLARLVGVDASVVSSKLGPERAGGDGKGSATKA